MATVYLARDVKHDRKVALKVLRPELSSAMGSERFPREIRLVAQFNHPHILSLHDSGEAAGLLYYVMPFVEGETLAERLTRDHQLPVNDALRILREVADALAYAHARGVVHRDIKPANILLSGRHAVVADFGVAKALQTASGDKLTTVGIAIGTPQYMAPEQATGESDIDGRADIYALGILGYEMLAGRPPFNGTAQAILAAHVMTPPPDLDDIRPGLPKVLVDTLARCLAKNPADRWQSAEELMSHLEAVGTTPSGGRLHSLFHATVQASSLFGNREHGFRLAPLTGHLFTASVAPPPQEKRVKMRSAQGVLRIMAAVLCVFTLGATAPHRTAGLPSMDPNDNRVAAGRRIGNETVVVLTARMGDWYPDGARRPAPLTVAGFAEGDGAPSIPGPLIRVRAGTRVRITIRNALDGTFAGKQLTVHGLHTHPIDSARAGVIHVAPGGEQTVAFDVGAPGTYHYWAAFNDTTINGRRRYDAGLSGAFVVDSATGPIPSDRILVMSRFQLPAEGEGAAHQPARFATTINGLSWPLTERFDAAVGDTVRWRWINASSNAHPMHLHGFFYTVDALGDERADTAYAGDLRKLVVTERMAPGATMSITWVPERTGNWLMHCHLQVHTGPNEGWGFPDIPGTKPFGLATEPTPPSASHDHDMMRDMAGLAVGVRVRAGRMQSVMLAGKAGERHDVKLTVLAREPGIDGTSQIATRVDDASAPSGLTSLKGVGMGPPIIVRQNENTRITVKNELDEQVAVHWHAMELESYFDGVPGWTGGVGGGGPGGSTSPMVETGGSFDALMTPPRHGTFIYHAHSLTSTQLADGLYGPLIVLASGEKYDPAGEAIFMIGGPTVSPTHKLVLNGAHAPPPMTLTAGRRYRVRVINIGETSTGDLTLFDGEGADARPLTWRAMAKDAVTLPTVRARVGPTTVRAYVGETFDFEFTAPSAGTLRMELRNGPNLQATQRIVVR